MVHSTLLKMLNVALHPRVVKSSHIHIAEGCARELKDEEMTSSQERKYIIWGR